MKLLLISTLAILLLTGCAQPTTSEAPPTTSSASAQVSDSLIESPDVSTGTNCAQIDYGNRLARFVFAWDLVITSRGAADHSRMMEGFNEDVTRLAEEIGDGCPGKFEITEIAYKASLLNLKTSLGEDAGDDAYEEIIEPGNAFLDAFGHTDHRFQMD